MNIIPISQNPYSWQKSHLSYNYNDNNKKKTYNQKEQSQKRLPEVIIEIVALTAGSAAVWVGTYRDTLLI